MSAAGAPSLTAERGKGGAEHDVASHRIGGAGHLDGDSAARGGRIRAPAHPQRRGPARCDVPSRGALAVRPAPQRHGLRRVLDARARVGHASTVRRHGMRAVHRGRPNPAAAPRGVPQGDARVPRRNGPRHRGLARAGQRNVRGGRRRRGDQRDGARRRELLAAAGVSPGGTSPFRRSRHAPVEPARIRSNRSTIRKLPRRPAGRGRDGPREDVRVHESRHKIRKAGQGVRVQPPDGIRAVVEAAARCAKGDGGELGVLPSPALVPPRGRLLGARHLTAHAQARRRRCPPG